MISGGSSGYWTASSVRFWNVQTGAAASLDKKFDCLPDLQPVSAIALSRDGETLAVACPTQSIRLWNLQTGKEMPSLRTGSSSAFLLEFSPDGVTLAASTYGGRVLTWNYQTAGLLQNVSVFAGQSVTALSFSPDGTQLATVGREGLQLRDAHAVEKVLTSLSLKSVYAVAFHPHDKSLAIGSGLDVQVLVPRCR